MILHGLGGRITRAARILDILETRGYVGSVEQASPAFATSVTNYVDKNDLLAFCDFAIAYLKGPLTKAISPDCTDLLNIIADMIGAFEHTKYLLRLA